MLSALVTEHVVLQSARSTLTGEAVAVAVVVAVAAYAAAPAWPWRSNRAAFTEG